MLPKYLKHFTFSSFFWSIVIVTGDGCLEILIAFVFLHIHFHAIVSTGNHHHKDKILAYEEMSHMNLELIRCCEHSKRRASCWLAEWQADT
jgi:hypothetical protein